MNIKMANNVTVPDSKGLAALAAGKFAVSKRTFSCIKHRF